MPVKDTLNVCMIGYRFMGRAHSNAYMKVDKFWDVDIHPVMHTVVGRNAKDLEAFAKRWGWQKATTDWRGSVADHHSGSRNQDGVSRLSVLPERRHGAPQWAAAAG